MQKQVKLGILAGMGPYSTAPFLNYVLDACKRLYGAKLDIDFPHMIIYSLPTPYQLKLKTNDSEIIECLKIGIETLCATDVDIIAVPCNSIHKFYSKMCEISSVPILNIIDETISQIDNKAVAVGILATRTAIASKLYQKGLKQNKIHYFWNEELQKNVDDLVLSFKKTGASTQTLQLWKKITVILKNSSIKHVIIGCTDLAFCADYNNKEFDLYDSSYALANSLVKKYIQLISFLDDMPLTPAEKTDRRKLKNR